MRVFLQKPRGNKLRYDVAYTNKGVAMYHKSDTQGLNKTKNSGSDLEFVVFFCFLLAVAHSFWIQILTWATPALAMWESYSMGVKFQTGFTMLPGYH